MSDRGALRYPSKRAAACIGLQFKERPNLEIFGDHIFRASFMDM